jgi:hypothetical protein
MLDSGAKGGKFAGARGETHDWTVSREIVEQSRTPVILAGGLICDSSKSFLSYAALVPHVRMRERAVSSPFQTVALTPAVRTSVEILRYSSFRSE